MGIFPIEENLTEWADTHSFAPVLVENMYLQNYMLNRSTSNNQSIGRTSGHDNFPTVILE
ncbi:unnamed protein product [Paramecium pentaurelia]|uniref:Uncharacterized protein n=1 Tax=Paramecium pentaurelia TaxID=43138 RepID=A0A8S1WQK0_9CILI|nr:unnamed protein product [Paramecium pentaurelia]